MNETNIHITKGVEVAVTTKYMQDYSSPEQMHFVFGYKVKITNNSPHTIQLMNRAWEIYDSCGINRTVNGEGVIGQRPILESGQSHEYTSGCNFKSSIGMMQGSYEFKKILDDTHFNVLVPEFTMVAPFKLN